MTDKFYAIVEFEDGLQVIPNNCLSGDLTKAFWPNFANNKRYDKAVKLMEEPECTWLEHPIRKIYGTFRKQCYILFWNILLQSFACKYVLIFLNNIRNYDLLNYTFIKNHLLNYI